MEERPETLAYARRPERVEDLGRTASWSAVIGVLAVGSVAISALVLVPLWIMIALGSTPWPNAIFSLAAILFLLAPVLGAIAVGLASRVPRDRRAAKVGMVTGWLAVSAALAMSAVAFPFVVVTGPAALISLMLYRRRRYVGGE